MESISTPSFDSLIITSISLITIPFIINSHSSYKEIDEDKFNTHILWISTHPHYLLLYDVKLDTKIGISTE